MGELGRGGGVLRSVYEFKGNLTKGVCEFCIDGSQSQDVMSKYANFV